MTDAASVTTLHGLTPIGVGTAAAESLTGYVSRLAASHSLPTGTLIMRAIAPALGHGRVYGADDHDRRSYFSPVLHGDEGRSLNGTGERAAAWAAALERLTGRPDLGGTTLVAFRATLPRRGLLALTRRYCAACSAERRASGDPPYDRLLFSLAPVRVCPWHGRLLMTSCWRTSCRQPVKYVTGNTRPDHCPHCGLWLGGDPAEAQPGDAYDVWVAQQAAALVARTGGDWAPSDVPATIRRWLDVHGWPAATLAARTGGSRSQVSSWLRGEVTPSLAALFRIAHALGTDVVALLQGAITPVAEPGVVPGARGRSSVNWPAVRRALRRALATDPRPRRRRSLPASRSTRATCEEARRNCSVRCRRDTPPGGERRQTRGGHGSQNASGRRWPSSLLAGDPPPGAMWRLCYRPACHCGKQPCRRNGKQRSLGGERERAISERSYTACCGDPVVGAVVGLLGRRPSPFHRRPLDRRRQHQRRSRGRPRRHVPGSAHRIADVPARTCSGRPPRRSVAARSQRRGRRPVEPAKSAERLRARSLPPRDAVNGRRARCLRPRRSRLAVTEDAYARVTRSLGAAACVRANRPTPLADRDERNQNHLVGTRGRSDDNAPVVVIHRWTRIGRPGPGLQSNGESSIGPHASSRQ